MKSENSTKLKVVKSRCKACNVKFGFDFDGHSQLEYLCLKQPKWKVRIFGKTCYYCSDKCLDKDFHYEQRKKLIRKKFLWIKAKYIDKKIWTNYKEKPDARFKLSLTKNYKLLGHNMWEPHQEVKVKKHI